MSSDRAGGLVSQPGSLAPLAAAALLGREWKLLYYPEGNQADTKNLGQPNTHASKICIEQAVPCIDLVLGESTRQI